GEQAMTLAPFRLQGLAAEVVEALESVAERASVQLRLAIPPDLPPLLGDVEQLRPVLANLVDNAIKYNNPGGFVEVAARAADGEVRVEVRDDGLGIPPEAIPRLTERFFRVDRSRSRQQGGTGLGLAIVKHVLEAHGQRLHVESRPGAGATFWFRLPVAPAPPAATPPRT